MTTLDDSVASPPLHEELDLARRLARRAGEVMLRHRASGISAGTKAGGEIVTAADLEADAVIAAGIHEAFPEDGLLSEEAADSDRRLACPRVWIVDPIDGTRDYADGGDEHAVSIGLAVRGRAVLGVVFNPARGELFAGTIAGGLTLGDVPARASAARDVASARITASRTESRAGVYKGAGALPIRPLSSAAYKLARVAAGLDDGTFWIWPRNEWDVCAGVALVVAGGGTITLLDGSAITFNRPDVLLQGGLVAAGSALHPALRAELLRSSFAR